MNFPTELKYIISAISSALPEENKEDWCEGIELATSTKHDLSLVAWKLLHWNLTDNLFIERDGECVPHARSAVTQCAEVLFPMTYGRPINKELAQIAIHQAGGAARAADNAYLATQSARKAVLAAAPPEVLRTEVVESFVAQKAASSLYDAANSIAVCSGEGEWTGAWQRSWQRMADKVLEIIEQERVA